MSNTYSLSLPAHGAEPLAACEDNSGSSCSISAHSIPVTQPQHRTVSRPAFDNCSLKSSDNPQTGQNKNQLKRSADSIRMNDTTRSEAAESIAEVSQGSGASPRKVVSNKKRRVSFCKTTKLPSLEPKPPISKINRLMGPKPTIMKQSASCTALPQLTSSDSQSSLLIVEPSTDELDLNVSPTTFVNTIVLQSRSITGSIRGEDIISDASKRVAHESYYLQYTDKHLEAYTTDKVNAVQGNDVETLRSLLEEGHLMQGTNRFGESMLHTSCRRGFTETVGFFLNEAKVSPRVRDDMGRTPMHDTCWASVAPNHDIMRMLISAAPELLLSKDKRGHSPFDYARREHWPNWVTFLNDHRQFIVNSLVSSYLDSVDHNVGLSLEDNTVNQ
mmetsp:Transcript_24507/g.41960  ORF Transcript_24507/g.41960 Transcript_24507/m.41960 type:complete len:387 (+) Transcript_24507:100-1260(+)